MSLVIHFYQSGYRNFKGYYHQQDLHLITTIRKNMKPQLMSLWNRLILRKRFVIETIFDQLKNISQIEHTRHCNAKNFIVNLIAGLIAYTHQPLKPAIKLSSTEQQALITLT